MQRLARMRFAFGAQDFEEVAAGGHVDQDFATLAPVGGDLQDRRAADAPVGEQHGLVEAGLAAGNPHIHRHPGQGLQPFKHANFKGQRYEGRAGLCHRQAELAGDVIGKPRRSHLGDRLAAGGDDQRLGADCSHGPGKDKAAVFALDGLNGGLQAKFDARCLHFGQQHGDDLPGAVVTEQLAQGLLMPGDAVALDQGDEVGGCVPLESGYAEARVLR